MPSASTDRGRASATPPPAGERLRERVRFVVDGVLRSYAQILFSGSRGVGLVLLLATFLAPRAGAYGVLAVLAAIASARLFRLSPELTRSGLLSYSSMLVGLGAAVLFQPTIDAIVVTLVGVVTAVLMTAALHAAMSAYFNLPPLTLPFLLVFYLVLGAARVLDIPLEGLAHARIPTPEWLPAAGVTYLESLGALFFLPRIDVGAIVLLALILHSRIAWLLSLVGVALALLVAGRVVLVLDGTLPFVLGYNFVLMAIAVGGVWFVPSRSSLLLAIGATLVCGMVTVGLVPLLTVGGLPLLILPFNLTIILLLYAMRLRLVDDSPKAVDDPSGSPEEHLRLHATRVARFGAHFRIRFHAPFMGRWRCTQGFDGEFTHREAWRHAWDFEVTGPDGQVHRGSGEQPQDYYCYRLPVVAAADGTVVEIVDSVADSPIGEPNLRDNWGNLVLVAHAPGLYSLVCHLAPGSVEVRPGQLVRRGDRLGLCGSSGRSPVPHLHFQLQSSPHVGAPTLAGELHDVVVEADDGIDERRWHATYTPKRGDVVRNLEPARAFARFLPLRAGDEFTLRGDHGDEAIAVKVDLRGQLLLCSRARKAETHFERNAEMLILYETRGDRRSLLWALQIALARLPFELGDELRWSDHVQRRDLMSWPAQLAHDVVAPFIGDTSLVVDYELDRRGHELRICGRSRATGRDKAPLITSEALLVEDRGITRIEVTVGERRIVATRVDDDSDDDATAAAVAMEGAGR
ncbi:MAG: urea transporter [Myxococcales bacterium]|nr:urea transporter [Myxococcales bacterium]